MAVDVATMMVMLTTIVAPSLPLQGAWRKGSSEWAPLLDRQMLPPPNRRATGGVRLTPRARCHPRSPSGGGSTLNKWRWWTSACNAT